VARPALALQYKGATKGGGDDDDGEEDEDRLRREV